VKKGSEGIHRDGMNPIDREKGERRNPFKLNPLYFRKGKPKCYIVSYNPICEFYMFLTENN